MKILYKDTPNYYIIGLISLKNLLKEFNIEYKDSNGAIYINDEKWEQFILKLIKEKPYIVKSMTSYINDVNNTNNPISAYIFNYLRNNAKKFFDEYMNNKKSENFNILHNTIKDYNENFVREIIKTIEEVYNEEDYGKVFSISLFLRDPSIGKRKLLYELTSTYTFASMKVVPGFNQELIIKELPINSLILHLFIYALEINIRGKIVDGINVISAFIISDNEDRTRLIYENLQSSYGSISALLLEIENISRRFKIPVRIFLKVTFNKKKTIIEFNRNIFNAINNREIDIRINDGIIVYINGLNNSLPYRDIAKTIAKHSEIDIDVQKLTKLLRLLDNDELVNKRLIDIVKSNKEVFKEIIKLSVESKIHPKTALTIIGRAFIEHNRQTKIYRDFNKLSVKDIKNLYKIIVSRNEKLIKKLKNNKKISIYVKQLI